MTSRTLLQILFFGSVIWIFLLIPQVKSASISDITECGTSQCLTTVQPASASWPQQSLEFFSSLLDTRQWPARWNCGEWSPFHGWLYIISDILIWLSYFAIPIILGVIVLKDRGGAIPFKKIFVLFMSFILACGLTHLIDAIIFYWPVYRLSALVRAVTAGVSMMTVFSLTKVTPWVLELKSPIELERLVKERTYELRETNRKLQEEIGQRKKAEEEIASLNKSLKDFQQAIRNSSIVSRANRKGLITYVNRNFEKISGFHEQELLGKDHKIINSGYHPQEFWVDMWKTIVSGNNWRGEVRNKAKNGEYYWVDTFIMPFKNEDGSVREFLSIRNDITARKVAEREILAMNVSLEESVRARTQKLQAINKELEAFTYSVSHDLRAPLRSIDGYAGILYEDYFDNLDEEGKKTLLIIMRNAKKMGQLIDDLLEFSRFGRNDMSWITINMTPLAEQVAEELIALEKDRKIEIDIQPLMVVRADAGMIRQVWGNLISNAIKYTRKQEVAVIEIGSKVLEGGEVCFHVKDNGVGFNMKYADKLFGVFQRLHKQEEFEGTGVGLALVHRIVTRHGGKVWVESEENKGTTFYFSIPGIEQLTLQK